MQKGIKEFQKFFAHTIIHQFRVFELVMLDVVICNISILCIQQGASEGTQYWGRDCRDLVCRASKLKNPIVTRNSPL